MKKALIIGSEGQDGKLLTLFLKEKDYIIHGIGREKSNESQLDKFTLLDLNSPENITRYLNEKNEQYDEVYYIAAYHHSAVDSGLNDQSALVTNSFNVNLLSFVNVLNYIQNKSIHTKVFYCSSSLIYEGIDNHVQTEETIPQPESIYAITKHSAMQIAKHYRDFHGIFVTVGILYNHESLFRKDNFLSKIIINGVKEIVEGSSKTFQIGNLSSQTDWGYAYDYVEAMWHLLQLEDSGEYIISSNQLKEVKDWLEVLSRNLNFQWKECVIENPNLLKRKKKALQGDNSKLKNTGWYPKTNFEEMVMKIYNNQI